jgi:transcription elongation factor Elf1
MSGKLKKISSDRWKIPERHQPTLIECPACNANGYKIEDDGHNYKQILCKWCDGSGGVMKPIFEAFQRIKRIYKINSK